MHKISNIGIFILLKFEDYIYYNSKHYDKRKSVLKLIRLLTIYNLFIKRCRKNANIAIFLLQENSIVCRIRFQEKLRKF